jgi:hypothetical protein
MTILKDKVVPTEFRYFSDRGALVRTETRSAYECAEGHCAPGELKMVDHAKGGHWSKITRKVWKVNPALAEDLFSKRSLGE